jgi:hypothetical protein
MQETWGPVFDEHAPSPYFSCPSNKHREIYASFELCVFLQNLEDNLKDFQLSESDPESEADSEDD